MPFSWLRYLLILLCFIGQAHADWDRIDYALGATAVAGLVVDWGQTRYIAKHPDTHSEKNRILGKHPSVGRVDTYFAGTIAGTLLFANWLSPTNRKIFLGTITAVELVVTNRNRSLGVKISF